MKSIQAKVLLDTLETQVELHLTEAVKSFQNLSKELLLQPAPEGGWSVAQCLEHLNRYGNYYLPEIKKGLAKNSQPNENFKSSWLGNYFTKMMNPVTGKRKMTTFKEYSPLPKLDAHQVVAEFIRQQETLLGLLRAARSRNLSKTKVAISISRWIKLQLGDTFQFLIAHNERHIQQAKRNLASHALI